MAEEIRKVLNLSLGESPKNLRELKGEINEIKTAIGDMVVAGQTGTTAFDQATKLLAQDMAVLRQTQNATKSEVAALDGSYNALVQTMRVLKTEWRATNNEARRVKLGQEINKINNELKKLDASVGNYGRNVGNYASMWDGLPKAINNAKKAGNDFSAGLQAMTSLLGLCTTDSEQMNKALGVMDSSFRILNGSKGILGFVKNTRDQIKATREAKKAAQEEAAALKQQEKAQEKTTLATKAGTLATKAFKLALMSIGIGLVIEGLSLLSQNIDKVVGWFTKLGEKLKLINPETQKLKKSNDLLNESIEKQNDALEKDVELMQAKGEDSQKVLQTQLKVIQAEILEAKAVNEKVKARIDELETLGKRRGELKKLQEQYEKNNKTIEDLEHKQAVLSAKYDTEERSRAAKAAADRAAAAKKAADDRLKADQKAAQELAKAREEAEKVVSSIMEKGMTEREKLSKEHTETLKNLEKSRAHITAESYEAAVKAENAYYSKQLAETVAEEYTSAYEKAATDFDNRIKSSKVMSAVSQTLRSVFDAGDFYNDSRVLKTSLKGLEKYYAGIATEALRILDKYKEDLNPMASDAYKGIASNGSGLDMLNEIRDYYSQYLADTEKFLETYGEPFTTAIIKTGEQYEAFAEEHTQGIIAVFNRELEAISEVADGGAINTAQGALDRLWKKYGDLFLEMGGEPLSRSMKNFLMRFSSEMSNGLTDIVGAGGNAQAEAIRQSYESLFNALLTQQGEWRKAVREGIVEEETAAQAIAGIEADLRRMTIERDSKMYEARVKMLRKYVSASTNLFDNVASAWEAVIKARVKSGKMSDEQARESFEKMKKLQYATAVINTASGVAQALSDPAVPTYYLRAINAAAALAAGVAQIAKIASTSYDSAGSSATSTPQLVDRTPVQQTVSLNAMEAGQGVAENMRVYVVESDITEAQNRSRARVSESTF